MYTMM
jgi:hypothetical protein